MDRKRAEQVYTEVDTVAELAAELNVARQTLYDWHREGCPVHAGAEAIRRWHADHKRPTNRNRHVRSKLLDAPEEPEPLDLLAAQHDALLDAVDAYKAAGDVPAADLDAWLLDGMRCFWQRLTANQDKHHHGAAEFYALMRQAGVTPDAS
jgi:hypothetical protein